MNVPPPRTQWRDSPGYRPGRVGQLGRNPTVVRIWALGCPLWQWRVQHKITRVVASSLLRVSHTTVQSWEYGVYQPNRQHMGRLSDVLGPDVAEEWAEWMTRKPAVKDPLLRSDPEVQAILRDQEARAREMAAEMAAQLEALDALIDAEGGADNDP